MKRYIKSTGYKSGDRYYGGLPAEPSDVEYGEAMSSARNSFNKFLSDNQVAVEDIEPSGNNAKYQSYTWTTPDDRDIEIIYYNRFSGGSQISSMFVDGRKVDIYNSKYDGWKSLKDASLMEVISAFNSDNYKLSLVFYN